MADEVHTFLSTDTNAPVLTGETGKLVDLLTAILVDGYTTVSVTSITRSGATATVTTGSSHGLVTGQMATIAGAVETDYNGRYIVTVSSSTVFTYTVANSPTTPATGTITSRRASAGWDLAYSGTNKAVYRSPNNASARHYLRVLDDASSGGGAKEGVVRGYVSMSDVDTGTEPFPTVAQQATGLYAQKSITANSTARTWWAFADDKTFYLAIANGTSTLIYGFGHFQSFASGDAYNTLISFSKNSNSATATSQCSGIQAGQSAASNATHSTAVLYCPRSYTQSGTSIIASSFGSGHSGSTGAAAAAHGGTTSSGSHGVAIPSSNADGAFYCASIHVMEMVASNANVIRGKIPGIYAPMHPQGTISSGTVSTGINGLNGKNVYHLDHNSMNVSSSALAGQLLFDQTGPW